MNQQPSKVSGHDAPIESIENDLLNGYGVARAIHRVLSTTPPNWSTRVGLYGPWGSGKTSILNLLRKLEEANGSLVVSFSAWSATSENGVVTQFYRILSERLKAERIQIPAMQRAKAAATKIGRFEFLGRLIKKGAEEFTPAPPAITKAATEALSGLASAASSWTKISSKDLDAISALLSGRRVVVFVDDLDRADPKVIPKTLLAMRELLDWPGFSFILAFDRRAISSALYEYSAAFGEDAQGFLEKVIDVPFEVPDPTSDQRERLALAALETCCDPMPAQAVASILSVLPNQPRRVKLIARMMGALRPALLRHGLEDVDWTGLGLYLVVKEASQVAADWLVKAATAEGSDWLLWSGGEKERKDKEQRARQVLLDLLSEPKLPSDADRIVDATIQLLRHWDMTSRTSILYWVGLVYREPSITLNELRRLRDDFAVSKSSNLVDDAIRLGRRNAGISDLDVALDLLLASLASYRDALDSMAGARTSVEWKCRLTEAQSTLLLLEHVWLQQANHALAAAAQQGPVTAELLALVSKWLTWTKNEGEPALRQREQVLAHAAAENCNDPELLFAGTDPFRDSLVAESPAGAQLTQTWLATLRNTLTPRIVFRLCDAFQKVDGLVDTAAGEGEVGPWLVESKESPLYANPEMAKKLIEGLRSGHQASESARATLSKNARLYLRQLLFQTRSASWGGLDDAKAINATNPDIVPTAWAAVVDVPAPYRMRSSLRKLRKDLVGIGVSSELLPEPTWLAVKLQ